MTQTAQVKDILADGWAQVSVHRRSACSHDCRDCSGCELTMARSDITVTAENYLGAGLGDTVLVESANSDILGAAMLVYLVPFLLFFAGYLIVQVFSLGEGLSIVAAFVGFAGGLLLARRLDRRVKEKNSMRFRIIEIMKSCSDI